MQKSRARSPVSDSITFHSDELRIDEMKLSDLCEVLAIENRCFYWPWNRSAFAQEIRNNPLSYPFVLRKKEKGQFLVVGFLVCWILQKELHINNVAVDPNYRRRGYGELLVRNALGFAEGNGRCKRATLEVRVSNQTAINLYEKLGFTKKGFVPGYYEDNLEDAYIFTREICRR